MVRFNALNLSDPVQVHASGFMHMRYFLQKPEYIVGVSADMSFSSYEVANSIAANWNQSGSHDPGFKGRQRIVQQMSDYMLAEYKVRCRRHAFYDDLGYGGKMVVQSMDIALNRLTGQQQSLRAPVRSRPPRS